nr:hypothetical transcript [Hymenolepis microstoma]
MISDAFQEYNEVIKSAIAKDCQCIAKCQTVQEKYAAVEDDVTLVKSIVDGLPKFVPRISHEHEEKTEDIQEKKDAVENVENQEALPTGPSQECTGEVQNAEVNEAPSAPETASVHETCADVQETVEHMENQEALPTGPSQECTGEVQNTEVNEVPCAPETSSVHETSADAQDAVEHVENQEALPTGPSQECTGEVQNTEVNEAPCAPETSSVHETCANVQAKCVFTEDLVKRNEKAGVRCLTRRLGLFE